MKEKHSPKINRAQNEREKKMYSYKNYMLEHMLFYFNYKRNFIK